MPVHMQQDDCNKKKKKTDNNKCWQECGETGNLALCWWESKMLQSLWKILWQCFKMLNIQLSYDPAILFLGLHPRNEKIYTPKNAHTNVHNGIIHNNQKVEIQMSIY